MKALALVGVAFTLLLPIAIAAAEPAAKDPAHSQTAGALVQTHDIPQPVQAAITNGSMGKKYEVSFHLSPFYLRGDFDGDHKIDIAVLVKQRSTGKLGIAIIHGLAKKVTILGAGTAIGNGDDDFEWMDDWQIYTKDAGAKAAGAQILPHLRGDALLVSKSEAGSALIYWNGKRYVWFQRGD
jgi:hypothetical protein